MRLNYKTLAMMAASMISASALGPIIELPPDYDLESPWKELAALGLTNLTETDCQRTCVAGEPPRVCLYTLILELYAAMGTACGRCNQGVLEDCFRSQCIPADGYERGVMSINRKIPGPAIHVCKHDLIVANVENNMPGSEVTIHWHGIQQKHSQWMDGVPHITQCPIGANSFRYIFPVEEAGTYFYHSHTGLHRPNGHYGALIIRKPRSEQFWPRNIYDFDLPDHVIMISDWIHYTAEMFFPGLPTLKPGPIPSSFLINGVGRFLNGSDDDQSFNVPHPLATFHVERNHRYRFRIINGNNMLCPVLIQIEDHNLTLIATDGRPIKPVVVDGIVSYAGERYDVVIDTNNIPLEKNSFWIHFRGLEVCEVNYQLEQYAVLSYGTNSSLLGIIPEGRRPTIANPLLNNTIVNHPEATCGASPKRLCITDLRAIEHDKEKAILMAEPDVRLFIPFGFHAYGNVDEFHKEGNYHKFMNLRGDNIRSGMMNNISFEFPSTPSLYLRDAEDHGFCCPDNLPPECDGNVESPKYYCECPQFVTVKENDIVEITLINHDNATNGVDHPFHLHGYSFHVMYMHHNQSRTEVYTVDEAKQILLEVGAKASNSSGFIPALKDTVNVPVKGFVTVRFMANNPGDWLLHCHFEWHASVGMMMVLRVQGKISKKPPGFPTCGNFDPLLLPVDV